MKAPIYFDGKQIGLATDLSYELIPAEGEILGDGKSICAEVVTSFEVTLDSTAEIYEILREPASPKKLFMSWDVSNLRFGTEGSVKDGIGPDQSMTFTPQGRSYIRCRRCGAGRLYNSFSRLTRRIPRWQRHRCARGHSGASK